MSVTQAENGTWEVSVWYKDWQDERKRKRGFATKREAKTWESAFIARQDGSPDMRMHMTFTSSIARTVCLDRFRDAIRLVVHDDGKQIVSVGEAVASRLVDEDAEFSHCSPE